MVPTPQLHPDHQSRFFGRHSRRRATTAVRGFPIGTPRRRSLPAVRYHRRVLGIFYTLIFMATSSVAGPFTVGVVLDGSETMLLPVAGTTIQTKVREAVITTISEAAARQDDLVIGLRVAGGGSCSVSDPLVPVGPPDWDRWTKALSGIHPKGKRPLFQTVASAVADVARGGAPSRVVVITTGGDQCGAGIEEIAGALTSSQGAVEVRVVGLNLDPSTLASFGSVQVRNATDPSQLLDAVRWGVIERKDPGVDAAAADPTPTEIPATLTAPSEIAAGAEIVIEIRDEDYGGRHYSCRDPEGHVWNFGSYDPWASA